MDQAAPWVVRRARPALGTILEIGLISDDAMSFSVCEATIRRAFARVAELEHSLSRFIENSDVARFNAAASGSSVQVGSDARFVLSEASGLREETDGLFDVSVGSGIYGWSLQGSRLHKHAAGVRLDLGGIAKGYAVDAAVEMLLADGAPVGWVNGGGDLRAFGEHAMPIDLRDEEAGGARSFGTITDGAFATSVLGRRHVSIAAPRCIDADALTKVLAMTGDKKHSALTARGATGWIHA